MPRPGQIKCQSIMNGIKYFDEQLVSSSTAKNATPPHIRRSGVSPLLGDIGQECHLSSVTFY